MNLAQWSNEHPRASKLANNTYLERLPDGALGVRLHSTVILYQYPDGRIMLHVGRWQTVTTKARLNEFLPPGFRVYSVKGIWYLAKGGIEYPFADGVTIHPDSQVTGAGEDPAAKLKLRRQAKKFAADYMTAFESGEVPPPSNGDCWGCLMKAIDGSAPMGGADHIISHMSADERYFVPSLLVRAIERFPVSQAAKWCIGKKWGESSMREADWFDKVGLDQLRRALYRYLCVELGTVG